MLLVEGIEADAVDLVRFDVYVNAREYHMVRPGGRVLRYPEASRQGGNGSRDQHDGGAK